MNQPRRGARPPRFLFSFSSPRAAGAARLHRGGFPGTLPLTPPAGGRRRGLAPPQLPSADSANCKNLRAPPAASFPQSSRLAAASPERPAGRRGFEAQPEGAGARGWPKGRRGAAGRRRAVENPARSARRAPPATRRGARGAPGAQARAARTCPAGPRRRSPARAPSVPDRTLDPSPREAACRPSQSPLRDDV